MALARADALRAEIKHLKASIRRDRQALAERAAELAALQSPAIGIRLVVLEQEGEGEIPWPSRSSPSTR
jgi:hypothetical protein